MDFTDIDIDEFRALWREEFGKEISAEDVRARAHEIIELLRALSRNEVSESEDDGF